MELKEKCIYYNKSNNGYYLVLSVSDMIYGRYGNMATPSYLDAYMNQETGLQFKIDDIIINRDFYRNYCLDDKELDEFELVRELAYEEFYPMELLINSNYRYPAVVINVHKHMNEVSAIVEMLKNKKSELAELSKEIDSLEKKLFASMK